MALPAEKLVGRTAELASLDDALAALHRGRAAVVEVAGEPGIGKTTLLEELAARADGRGFLVLSGSAAEIEGEVPFGVFVDAIDEYVQGIPPHQLADLDDDARAQLGHVLPSLPASDPTPDGPALQDERYRTHRAARRLLEALATPDPLALILDDVHWADSGSIDLLGTLLRRPPAAPVLIALGLRPRQVSERLAGALERASRGGTSTRLELSPLTRDEAGRLLGEAMDAKAVAALYEESAGNPFYLEQLARAPQRAAPTATGVPLAGVKVPRGVAAALAEELAVLEPAERRLLDGAAVAGDRFEPELAAAAADLPPATAIDAVDELLRRDMIRPTEVPRRFRFRHPLVRGAVYEAAPAGWRLGAHERCAEALAARGATAVERAPHVERYARQGDLASVAVLREAAEAVGARAPASAARLYAAGARLLAPGNPERATLLMALGGAHTAAGDFREAYEATRESLAELPADAAQVRVRLTAAAAGLENVLGRHDDARRRLTTALGELSDTSSQEAVALMLELAVDRLYRLDYAGTRDWAQRALETARGLGRQEVTANAAAMLTLACVCTGDTDQARAAHAETAALIDGMSDAELAPCVVAAARLGGAEVCLDRYEQAGQHAERALRVARATGQAHHATLLFWVGTVRRERAELGEAAEILDTAIEVGRLNGLTLGMGWNLFNRSLVATAAGDADTALATAEECAEGLRAMPSSFGSAGAGAALAAARLATGDAAGAVEALLTWAGGERLPSLQAGWRTAGLELLTRARLQLNQPDEAARAAAHAQELAGAQGTRIARALADRATAAVALETGDPPAAAERALASAAAADEVGATLEASHARILAGRALAAAGDPDRAAVELTRAAATFDGAGAERHRDAAERELRRLGHRRLHRRTRPGARDGSGIESLTERERQVAELVVDRKTNPQIAAELFLSQKTVESHLRNLFHKLDVSSRVEVARIMERSRREG